MAVDSKSVLYGSLVLVTLLLGVLMAISVTTNSAGGLAALVPLITVVLTIVSLLNPKAGLYGLAALVIWVDEFKRLAIYFGGANSMTVAQTLAMPFIILGALNCGFLLNVLNGKARIDRLGILIYLVGGMVGMIVFITMEGGIAERGQRAANIAGYVTLIPIANAYFKTFDEWRKFFAFQVMVALPAAAWAIKQYYYGFDQIEWTYARSMLSRVHSGQMLLFTNPRTFGFFGSASALGCAAIYCAFSWWHGVRYKKGRLFWLFAGLVLTWVLVASTQRTALIYPAIVLFCAYGFRTRLRTTILYTTSFVIVLLGIINSTYLLDQGLDKINDAIASDSTWGSEVLKVSTFSDRLRGWERLSRADSYSLIGKGEKAGGYDDGNVYRNHDVVNKVLISYGVLGLLAIAITGGIVLYALHTTVFSQENKQDRNDNAFAIALSLPMIYISFLGGDNFNTNPINLQIWTAFVGVLVARNQLRDKKEYEKRENVAYQSSPASSTQRLKA